MLLRGHGSSRKRNSGRVSGGLLGFSASSRRNAAVHTTKSVPGDKKNAPELAGRGAMARILGQNEPGSKPVGGGRGGGERGGGETSWG